MNKEVKISKEQREKLKEEIKAELKPKFVVPKFFKFTNRKMIIFMGLIGAFFIIFLYGMATNTVFSNPYLMFLVNMFGWGNMNASLIDEMFSIFLFGGFFYFITCLIDLLFQEEFTDKMLLSKKDREEFEKEKEEK